MDVYYFLRSILLALIHLSVFKSIVLTKWHAPDSIWRVAAFCSLRKCLHSLLSNSINVNHLTPAFCVWAKHSTCVWFMVMPQLNHEDLLEVVWTEWEHSYTLSLWMLLVTQSLMVVLCLLPVCLNTSPDKQMLSQFTKDAQYSFISSTSMYLWGKLIT